MEFFLPLLAGVVGLTIIIKQVFFHLPAGIWRTAIRSLLVPVVKEVWFHTQMRACVRMKMTDARMRSMFYLPGMMFVVAIGQCMQLGSVNLAESTISAFIVAAFNASAVLYLLHGLSYVELYKQRFKSLAVFFRARCNREARVASSEDLEAEVSLQQEPIQLRLPALGQTRAAQSAPAADVGSAVVSDECMLAAPSTDADGSVAMGLSRSPSGEAACDREGPLERSESCASSSRSLPTLEAAAVREATSGSEPATAPLHAASDREGHANRAAPSEVCLDVGGTPGTFPEAESLGSRDTRTGAFAMQGPVSLEDQEEDSNVEDESTPASQKRRGRSLLQHVQRHRRASVAMENNLEAQRSLKSSTGSPLSRILHRFSLRGSKIASFNMPASVVAMGTFVHNKIEHSSFASSFSSNFSSFGSSFVNKARGGSFLKSFFVRASEEEIVEIERIEVCTNRLILLPHFPGLS